MKDKQIIVLMGGPSEEAERISSHRRCYCRSTCEAKGYKAQTLELNPRTVLKDIDSLGGEVVI